MKVSVIIPTLNESSYLPEALNNLQSQDPLPDEIIITDAGSDDGTVELANCRGCAVIHAERSIGIQMNTGADKASGDVLVFLHADCRLEQNAFGDLLNRMSINDVVGGAFNLQLCGNRPLLDRYLSWSGSWNARHSQMYLGDHAIFCRRTVFQDIGGFPDVNLMYEFEFMTKLRQAGRLIQLNKKCYASARRFQRDGYWKTMFLMRSLRTFYRLGLPTVPLERFYQKNGDPRNI